MAEQEKQPDSPNEDEKSIEREILEGRKFSWEEAIARQVGKDLMKGASPITTKQQAELAVENYVGQQVPDAERALRIALDRRVTESEVLFQMNYEQPLVALAIYVEDLLNSENRLVEFVREVDTQWGQLYGERPYFHKPGSAPHPDDPYPIESVRQKLASLLNFMRGGE